MARLAILIDAEYLHRVARDNFSATIDYEVFPNEILRIVSADVPEPLELLRTYFYDALPFVGGQLSSADSARRSGKARFFNFLRLLPKFEVREGWVAYRGTDANGHPVYQQKQVDVLLGLDIALLSARRLITHMAVVAGDSDLAPAVAAAQQEGVVVWLFHGGLSPERGAPSVARSLGEQVDIRYELNQDFMSRVQRRTS